MQYSIICDRITKFTIETNIVHTIWLNWFHHWIQPAGCGLKTKSHINLSMCFLRCERQERPQWKVLSVLLVFWNVSGSFCIYEKWPNSNFNDSISNVCNCFGRLVDFGWKIAHRNNFLGKFDAWKMSLSIKNVPGCRVD